MSTKNTIGYADLSMLAQDYVVGYGDQKISNVATLRTTVDVDGNFEISKDEWDAAIASGSIDWLIDPFRKDEFHLQGSGLFYEIGPQVAAQPSPAQPSPAQPSPAQPSPAQPLLLM
ncbi:hypothetical protein K1X76_12635 [bacterium]|nr:hypothetical protein [bacterium]